MDTKKALIIIMVLLILMNIALASYIMVLRGRNEQVLEISEYTVEILGRRNISVNCSIPTEKPKTGSVVLGGMRYGANSIALLQAATGGSYVLIENGRLIYTADVGNAGSPAGFGRTEVEGIARDYMEKIGLQKNEFTLDMINETGDDIYIVRYLNIDESGIRLFDSYVEMTVTPSGVVSAEISVIDISGQSSGTKEGLLVGTVMLTHLVAEKTETAVDEIKYGYHRVKDDSNESALSWRIRFADGKERFFNLETGVEITPMIDMLGYKNIKFECILPENPVIYERISYDGSMFTSQDISSMQTTLPVISINDNDVFTYEQSGYDTNTNYDLNENLVNELSAAFINRTSRDSDDYIIDSISLNDDGSYSAVYIYEDNNGGLHFNNYFKLQLNNTGVAGAEFRENDFSSSGGSMLTGKNIGVILNKNLDTSDGSEYIITEIDVGYLGIPGDPTKANAVWRVKFKDGETKWYSAVDGSELSPDE